jgi:hypothetical protein
MKTAVEKIIEEIDNEVDFLKTHQYIAEVRGRMIGLAFAKRVALELKELEMKHLAQAFEDGEHNYFYSKKTGEDFETGIEYYNEKFKKDEQ